MYGDFSGGAQHELDHLQISIHGKGSLINPKAAAFRDGVGSERADVVKNDARWPWSWVFRQPRKVRIQIQNGYFKAALFQIQRDIADPAIVKSAVLGEKFSDPVCGELHGRMLWRVDFR